MWEIYAELISLVPAELKIKECMTGLNWFLVRSQGVGIAMTPREGNRNYCFADKIIGSPVREIAQWIMSWNNYEAAMGLAALNSAINIPARLEETLGIKLAEQPAEQVFTFMQDRLRGKKVAVIGHFRELETLAPICRLSVLERLPLAGDYPDPACEYILPQQDYVFITATTLINKTLPRLLELSRQAYVVLVGPSTPLTPVLFKYGVDMLAGTAVVDRPRVWRLMQEGDQQQFFQSGGRMVKITDEDWREHFQVENCSVVRLAK